MLIVELNEGGETLQDIERVCEHFVENKDIAKLITPEDRKEFELILKPTLNADHNEDEKRKHWRHLVDNFVMHTKDGTELRFYRDNQANRLYFGDKKGFDTIEDFVKHELEQDDKQ